MLQARCRPDFGQEAFRSDGRCEFWMKDLDGDGTVVTYIVREVDGGHPADAQFALDAIAIAEETTESGRQRGRQRGMRRAVRRCGQSTTVVHPPFTSRLHIATAEAPARRSGRSVVGRCITTLDRTFLAR